MLASLGMYDDPSYRHLVDAWWQGLANHLRKAGLTNLPESLDRSKPLSDLWLAPDLLLAQTCGLPFHLMLNGKVALLGRPSYRIDGVQPGHYRTAILARNDDPKIDAMLEGEPTTITPIINDGMSFSGMAALGGFLQQRASRSAIHAAIVSGGHAQSIQRLIKGEGNIASIDAVTLALLDRHKPGHSEGLRRIAWSDAFAGLPLITSLNRPETPAITEAIAATFSDPDLSDIRDGLLIDGWIDAAPDDYRHHGKLYRDATRAMKLP